MGDAIRPRDAKPAPAWLRHIRVARFTAVFGIGLVTLLPLRLVELAVRGPAPSRVASLFQRVLLWGLRLEARLDGRVAAHALVVANHISWIDILALGAVAPATFVSKADVRGWPLLGLLARLNPAVFVRRDARAAVPAQVAAIAAALAHGRVTLFAEGTTGDGSGVLPFHPALFAAATTTTGCVVQPVALLYTPQGRDWRPSELADFAWDGDKAFWPHLLAVAGGPPTRCLIAALAPIEAGSDRKLLANRCRTAIAARLGSPSDPRDEGARQSNSC